MKSINATARGFTLVELLAVIGVIALLLAILLPVLSAARRSARSIQCASNLRQIGIGVLEYVADSKGLLPNNSYTMGDAPALISPPLAPGTAAATVAAIRGQGSTCNYQWFDVVAAYNGWSGGRTIASRFAAGQAGKFRASTRYLWCPDIDQSARDAGVFATNYGMSILVSQAFAAKMEPRPIDADDYSFDFLAFGNVPHASEIVFLAECGFLNYNSEPYNASNGSMGNLKQINNNKMRPQIFHKGLNYLFFDGHVSCEQKPPHSLGRELGTFTTIENFQYRITADDETAIRQILAAQ